MREGGVTENYVAYPPTHIRITPRNERSADDDCAAAYGAREHHDHDEICACSTVNTANGNRHAEPKKSRQSEFWATSGQPVARTATARGSAKKCGCKKPLILAL